MLQLTHELEEKSSQLIELKELWEQEKEQWDKEIEMLKMNSELERLRQLEEVRDREHERFQQEQEKAEVLLAKLRKELANEEKNARMCMSPQVRVSRAAWKKSPMLTVVQMDPILSLGDR